MSPLKTIWQRYLYKEILKILILSLFCFFLLFTVIDYSVHLRGFLRVKQIDPLMIAAYYGFQFIKHFDVLLPLAILVATIKVLRSMAERHELLALQAAGFPLKRLMQPFLVVACLAALSNFAVGEFLSPSSGQHADDFQSTYLKHSKFEERKRLRILDLKDGSRLAFQRFESKSTTFHDIFWIRSIDDIWRIKTLTLDRDHPQAAPLCRYADHILRGQDGGLHKVESHEEIHLESLRAGAFQISKGRIPFEHYPLSKLFNEIRKEGAEKKERLSEMSAELFMKCARPFLSLLAVLSIAPFCVRFSRFSSAMPLYSFGIFGIIATLIAIQAGGILTQNQILSPWITIVLPLLGLLSWSSFRYMKL